MFTEFKQLFKPKNRDIVNRIVYTLLALLAFKIGTYIIVPGIDSLNTENLGFLELMNAMGGGALEKFSIFALGVMPYISASIIVQLLQADIIPYFSELSKQGGTGRAKLNKITRYMGIALAFIQGYVFSFAFVSNGSAIDYMSFAIILTAGTSLLLWIGDRITAKGVGNGISILIMAGIVATIPNMFNVVWGNLVDFSTTQTAIFGIIKFILFLLIYVAIILGVIFVETAERRIPIQYANKSVASKSNKNYIPFKLNSAGVMPVIFASMITLIPSLIESVTKNESVKFFISDWLSLDSVTGIILYVVCIVAFTFFYTFFQLKPAELAENINKSGGFIPGVRPGDETVEYFNKVLKRTTTLGATFLAVVAIIPILFGLIPALSSVKIGGTSILIVVGVALEVYRQLSSDLVTRSYTRGIKR